MIHKRVVFVTVKVEILEDDDQLETLTFFCRRLRNKFVQVLNDCSHWGEVIQVRDENDREVLTPEDYGL